MILPPYNVEIREVFGWQFLSDEGTPSERKWINLYSSMNLGAMLISPIIGIVRIIFSTYALIKNKNCDDNSELSSEAKQYLYGEIGRGLFELIGGGYLLWVVDLIATINRCWVEHHS